MDPADTARRCFATLAEGLGKRGVEVLGVVRVYRDVGSLKVYKISGMQRID